MICKRELAWECLNKMIEFRPPVSMSIGSGAIEFTDGQVVKWCGHLNVDDALIEGYFFYREAQIEREVSARRTAAEARSRE